MTKEAKILETDHNIGNCSGSRERLKDWMLCCENYHHCGYKIPKYQIKKLYKGHCFTKVVWECPICSATNKINVKRRKERIIPINIRSSKNHNIQNTSDTTTANAWKNVNFNFSYS